MIEKYKVIGELRADYMFYYVVKGPNYRFPTDFIFAEAAIELCDKLNRLAALEAVYREIVADAPTEEPEFISTSNYDDTYADGGIHTQWWIAQKLKAVLEEK